MEDARDTVSRAGLQRAPDTDAASLEPGSAEHLSDLRGFLGGLHLVSRDDFSQSHWL